MLWPVALSFGFGRKILLFQALLALYLCCGSLSPGALAVDAASLGLTYQRPAELVKPGTRIHFDREWGGWNFSQWELLITEVSDASFRGLVREVAGNAQPAGLARAVYSEVDGQINGEQFSFVVKDHNLENGSLADSWFGESIPGSRAQLAYGYQRGTSNYLMTIWKVESISPAELERIVAHNRQAVEAGKRQWEDIHDDVARLQSDGHDLAVRGLLETGQVNLEWNDRNSPKSGLAQLSYVHTIRFEGVSQAADLQFLIGLPHIGKVTLRGYTGEGIDSLASGPRIDGIRILGATSQGVTDLASLKSLKSVELVFHDREQRGGSADCLQSLNRLPELRELRLQNIPGDDPNALIHVAGITTLQDLRAQGWRSTFSPQSLRTVEQMPTLKSVHLGSAKRNALSKLNHPGLTRFSVTNSFGTDDSDLVGWDLPALERLHLPFWAPGDDADYFRRLRRMSPREYACYQGVRALKEIRENAADALALKEKVLVYGGMVIFDTRRIERAGLSKVIEEALNDASEAENAAQVLPGLADSIQLETADLVREGGLPLENALEIQAETFVYTGRWEQELKPHFTDANVAHLEKLRATYLEQLNKQ